MLGTFVPQHDVVAACAAPTISAVGQESAAPGGFWPTLTRGGAVRVRGDYFVDGCADAMRCATEPGCGGETRCEANEVVRPLQGVTLRMVQGDRTWELGRADATGPTNTVAWDVVVPRKARPDAATLEAVVGGRVRADAPVRLQ